MYYYKVKLTAKGFINYNGVLFVFQYIRKICDNTVPNTSNKEFAFTFKQFGPRNIIVNHVLKNLLFSDILDIAHRWS